MGVTRRLFIMRVFQFSVLLSGLMGLAIAGLARDDDNRGGSNRGGRVTLYEHADFRGGSLTLGVGELIENLTRARFSNGEGMNDRISSIRIEGDAQVIIFQDAGFRGGFRRIAHSVSDLSESAPGWNDAISSLRVEMSRGESGPDRDQPDFRHVDGMIRHAYRDILRRDADDRGLRLYRRHVLEDHWSEDQLRRALRDSDEFSDLVNRIILQAYTDLLGRAPDQSEQRRYSQQMIRAGWTEEELRNAIIRSGEYRKRPHTPVGR